MPYPNVPDKHDGDAIITPEKNAAYKDEHVDHDAEKAPEAVLLCFSESLFDYLVTEHDTHEIGEYYGELQAFEDTDGAVGAFGEFGIGAPTTAMVMEELIADGVEAFLAIGIAGCLQDHVEMGEFVVPDRAIRDEGTSYHYAESSKYAHPSDDLRETVAATLDERDDATHVGPTWTTDAIYRETVGEIERYADAGVLTVEMEASAVFTVADYRDVAAASTFVVSDYLGPDDWEPKFHQTEEDMQELGDVGKAVLEKSVR